MIIYYLCNLPNKKFKSLNMFCLIPVMYIFQHKYRPASPSPLIKEYIHHCLIHLNNIKIELDKECYMFIRLYSVDLSKIRHLPYQGNNENMYKINARFLKF